MNFNLLEGTSNFNVANKRNVIKITGMRTAPTAGNMHIYPDAAKCLNVSDGDRVVINMALPTLADDQFKVNWPVEPKPGCDLMLIYKGHKSDADRFKDEFADANAPAPVSGEERKEYNEQQAAYIAKRLKETGSDDVESNGNVIREHGSNYSLSSKTPWTYLGGTTETNVHYKFSDEFKVIAAYEDGTAAPLASVEDAADNVVGFVWVVGGPDSKKQFDFCAAGDEKLETAEMLPFFALAFDKEEDKNSRSDDDSDEDGTEGSSETEDGDEV